MNLNEINGSMYRKISEQIETGASVSYSRGGCSTFGMAAKYVPHEDTTFTVSTTPTSRYVIHKACGWSVFPQCRVSRWITAYYRVPTDQGKF